MITTISRAKIFHRSVLALFVLVPAAGALNLPQAELIRAASAREPERSRELSDADIAANLERLEQSPGDLDQRIGTLKGRLARKRAHLASLGARLAKARLEGDDGARARQVSRYAYQSFFAESRIAAEEDKLKEAEAEAALVDHLGTPRARMLMREQLEAARKARHQTAERLLQQAEHYGPWITETTFKAQLENLVKTIQSERERQS